MNPVVRAGMGGRATTGREDVEEDVGNAGGDEDSQRSSDEGDWQDD